MQQYCITMYKLIYKIQIELYKKRMGLDKHVQELYCLKIVKQIYDKICSCMIAG